MSKKREKTEQRKSLIGRIINGLVSFPHSEKVKDIDNEHYYLQKMLHRAGKADEIGITKEKSRNLLWFFLRRK